MPLYFETLAQIGLVIGFVLTFFVDNLSMAIRAEGKKIDEFPKSTLRATQSLLINRLGAALLFTSAAFMVDRGLGIKSIAATSGAGCLLLAALNLLYVNYYGHIAAALRSWIAADYSQMGRQEKISCRTNLNIFIAYPFCFNLLGSLGPMLLASVFPAYRATILQLGFIFNTLATVLHVFVIEPRFIETIEDKSSNRADEFHLSYTLSKSIFLFAGATVLLVCSL